MKRRDAHFEMVKRTRFLMSPRRKDASLMRFPRVSRYVCAIRRKTGLTQFEFCERYRFNLRTYQGWEAGRFRPNLDAQRKLKRIRK